MTITNQPLVSVIVPCYNQAIFLAETIECILAQTYINWECIIVNDGSSDNTEDIAKSYCARDNRVKYFYKKNGGLSSARNFGIVNSTGVYILPLDSDDKIADRYLELAVNVLNNDQQIKIAYCREELFGLKKGENILPNYSLDLMLCRNLIFCTAMYRRSDYDMTVGYNTNMIYGFEDWDFWLSILERGGQVYQINEVLFYYRIRKNSMATALKEEKSKKMRRQIWENHKELYANHFLDPTQCFEYQAISYSKEYLIGKIIMTPIRKVINVFR